MKYKLVDAGSIRKTRNGWVKELVEQLQSQPDKVAHFEVPQAQARRLQNNILSNANRSLKNGKRIRTKIDRENLFVWIEEDPP